MPFMKDHPKFPLKSKIVSTSSVYNNIKIRAGVRLIV